MIIIALTPISWLFLGSGSTLITLVPLSKLDTSYEVLLFLLIPCGLFWTFAPACSLFPLDKQHDKFKWAYRNIKVASFKLNLVVTLTGYHQYISWIWILVAFLTNDQNQDTTESNLTQETTVSWDPISQKYIGSYAYYSTEKSSL